MKMVKYMLVSANILMLILGGYLVCSKVTDLTVQVLLIGIFLSLCFLNLGSYFYFRSQFVTLSSQICRYSQQIMHGKSAENVWNKETLTSKVVMELEKMERIVAHQSAANKKEKQELQEMISEITHQIKNPLTNIKMYGDMLTDAEIHAEPSKQFMDIMRQQLGKVEFLLDALVKASRLETEMIVLKPSNSKMIETLALAVNHVIQKAEQKQIEISVECRPSIQVYHDMKWTAEAVENVLDNAVKYTPENGKINISVNVGEMYTEVRVKDTGKGIETSHFNDIFKRFYREAGVSKVEGLGLGLYLARNIIALQKGYISVRSVVGRGSCFSICLPNYVSE